MAEALHKSRCWAFTAHGRLDLEVCASATRPKITGVS